MPINPFPFFVLAALLAPVLGLGIGLVAKRFNPKANDTTSFGVLGGIMGWCAGALILLIGVGASPTFSATVKPTGEQLAMDPVTWCDYLVEHQRDLPRKIIAKSAIQAFALVESEGDPQQRDSFRNVARRLSSAAIPPRLDEADQKAVDALKPVAGPFAPSIAAEPVPDKSLDRISQLRQVAEGN